MLEKRKLQTTQKKKPREDPVCPRNIHVLGPLYFEPFLTFYLLTRSFHQITRLPIGSFFDLLEGLGNDTGSNGLAAFTKREPHAQVGRNRLQRLQLHLDIVTRHNHLVLVAVLFAGSVVGPDEFARDVGGTEVELRVVVFKEGGVATAFVFCQGVELDDEFFVGLDGSGGAEDHAAADLFTLETTEKGAHVVTSLASFEF